MDPTPHIVPLCLSSPAHRFVPRMWDIEGYTNTTGETGFAMLKNIILKAGPLGSIFQIGHRHQGRHRGAATRQGPTRFAWTRMTPDEPQTATSEHLNKGTAAQDFYVVFPNVPALPNNISS